MKFKVKDGKLLKDLAIAGGFMIIVAYGPGKISLDYYFKSKQE